LVSITQHAGPLALLKSCEQDREVTEGNQFFLSLLAISLLFSDGVALRLPLCAWLALMLVLVLVDGLDSLASP
jgi:hypothetical protein